MYAIDIDKTTQHVEIAKSNPQTQTPQILYPGVKGDQSTANTFPRDFWS